MSRDHHRALVAAQRLRRATDESALYARAMLLNTGSHMAAGTFGWKRRCFCPPTPPARTRTTRSSQSLHLLGARLADHVRFEEPELVAIGALVASGAAMAGRRDLWSDQTLQIKLTLVLVVAGLVVWHMRRPKMHALEAIIFLLSLVIVWLGLSIAHLDQSPIMRPRSHGLVRSRGPRGPEQGLSAAPRG